MPGTRLPFSTRPISFSEVFLFSTLRVYSPASKFFMNCVI